jgi:hypothetical protein
MQLCQSGSLLCLLRNLLQPQLHRLLLQAWHGSIASCGCTALQLAQQALCLTVTCWAAKVTCVLLQFGDYSCLIVTVTLNRKQQGRTSWPWQWLPKGHSADSLTTCTSLKQLVKQQGCTCGSRTSRPSRRGCGSAHSRGQWECTCMTRQSQIKCAMHQPREPYCEHGQKLDLEALRVRWSVGGGRAQVCMLRQSEQAASCAAACLIAQADQRAGSRQGAHAAPPDTTSSLK